MLRLCWARVDILVNNAGIQHVAPLESFPPAKWDQILSINLSAAFHTMRAVIPGMTAQALGPDRQHRLGAWPDRLAVQVGLRRRQARPGRADQGRRAGTRRDRRHLQRRLPGLRLDARWSSSRSTTQASSHGIRRDQVVRDVLLKNQPNKRFATVEELGALHRVPVLARRRFHHRGGPAGRWRLDCPLRLLVGGRDAGRHVPPVGHDRR